MIKGTNANCKITKVTITNTTATVTMLFFASQATVPSKAFRIYLKDIDTNEILAVNNNVYWIDQVNNYELDANNIDTNKHKEVMFTIDITNNNTSITKDNHWIRNCYIYLIDSEKDIYSVPAWSSDELNLISDDFDIPEIRNISFDTTELTNEFDMVYTNDFVLKGKIKAKFDLHYDKETDFNYNNKNFNAFMNIRSLATDNILETKHITSSSVGEYNEIQSENLYKVGEKFVVELCITNKNNDLLLSVRKIYKLIKKMSNTFIKTNDGIKRVIAYHVATDANIEHEGEFL